MNDIFEQERIQGLPASVDKHSAVLILGTLPGQMSLIRRKYYADPSNKFWDILFIACGEKIDRSGEFYFTSRKNDLGADFIYTKTPDGEEKEAVF